MGAEKKPLAVAKGVIGRGIVGVLLSPPAPPTNGLDIKTEFAGA